MGIRDWFNKTPTVNSPTKEEIRKATKRLEREKRITKAVYGDKDAFDERPYYHLYTFHDEFGYKKQTYPKYKKDVAMEMYKYCKKGMDKGIIGDTILLEGYKVEED